MKEKLPSWTTPEHLSKNDHEDLKQVYTLWKQGKLNEAMDYAASLDTIVREEIPSEIWISIGGKLAKVGQAKLKKPIARHPENNLDKFDSREDELNPRYMFSLTHSQLLAEAVKGEFDVNFLMRKELANRGLDRNGRWVGFDKAKEIHKV